MFELLKKAVKNEKEEQVRKEVEYLHGEYRENMMRRYLGTKTFEKWLNKEIADEKADEKATKKILKVAESELKNIIEKIEKVEKADELTQINIGVEWVESRTWGANPHATIQVRTVAGYEGTYCGAASGCGYDKQSAAVAEAFNQSPAILKALYMQAEKAIENVKTYRDFIGYGSGYSVLPYFEGGVGVSCFWNIFEKMGYIFENVASGKMFDAYSIRNKEV